MRIQLRLFLVMASLFLVLVAAACGEDAVHTFEIEPMVMAAPTSTALPLTATAVPPTATTVPLPSATGSSRSVGSRSLVAVATPTAEPDEISTPISRSTPIVIIFRAPEPPPTATVIPAPNPTQPPEQTQVSILLPTPQPTVISEPSPTSQPATATSVPPTPTAISPTATAITAPAGGEVIQLTGSDNSNSEAFWSPKRLPWVVEWDVQGSGSSPVVLTLMDPDGDIELVELVSDSGSGQIGGLTWVRGNMGKYYVKVEGVEGPWMIWIRPQ